MNKQELRQYKIHTSKVKELTGVDADLYVFTFEQIKDVIQQAIAEHEAAQWKKIEADAYEKSIGWKLNYDFLKTLAENAANASGEQVQMEVVEAVLIAFRELPKPYQEVVGNPFRPTTDSNPKAFKP